MIFGLGDSRTGTTSLNQWFVDLGLRPVHYFIRDAGLAEPLHRHRNANWPKLQRFLYDSGFDAFTDYPVRAFFREIIREFPKAYFILTTRRDIATWRSSMTHFFPEKTIDLDLLQAFHIAWNEEIRALCTETSCRFIEICIDDHTKDNSVRLARFLGLHAAPPIPHLNRSDWSHVVSAHRTDSKAMVAFTRVA